MKSWIHQISESYIGSRVASRKDLKEHYSFLTEKQRFGLLSENVLAYLQEQFKNAFGFDINELSEENIKSFLSMLFEFKGAEEVAARTKKAGGDSEEVEQAKQTRRRRLDTAARLVGPSDVPRDAKYTGYGWMTGDDSFIPRSAGVDPRLGGLRGSNSPLTIRRARTRDRLDAAQQGDDALALERKGDPAAKPTLQGAERSEELAKGLSGILKAAKARK